MMKSHESRHIALHNLTVGGLIGEGEISFEDPFRIEVNLENNKLAFIHNYISENELDSLVQVNLKRNQLTIYTQQKEFTHWYKNEQKVYVSSDVTYKSILIALILFGDRKMESLSIHTSVASKYLPTMAYSLEKILKVPIYAATKELKLFNTNNLFLNALMHLSLIECTELANFLTISEKRELRNILKDVEECEGGLMYGTS
ncbi:hypothetical protein D5E69_23175 (plasmid) [Rossellomorea marisflavi]|uniref:hypothetical protein n=1 Tax=Rossellomorea marisflavi TaxID=189381 RepID=UPI0013174593|nr:hypothetical protein [Rossellomorea marisflavi]QHA38737.1 hypothetical protein D5E69_23175 [Rossellomorea marisflavi]